MNLQIKGARHITTLSFLGERETQQDVIDWVKTLSAVANLQLAVLVADGHNIEGDMAARIAAETILRGPGFGVQSIRERFLEAHKIIELGQVKGGTTATLASICGRKLLIAWVGNSEARLVKRDGHLRTLTTPHQYGLHAKETARLDRAGAEIEYRSISRRRGFVAIDKGFLECSRMLGDGEFYPFVLPEPEIREVVITDNDKFLLIGTDGLWQTIGRGAKRRRVQEILVASTTADEARQQIEELLGRWRLQDNTTLAIIEL